MREVDVDVIRRASVILVDSKEACAKEAGELIFVGLGDEPTLHDKVIEVGEVTSGAKVLGEGGKDLTIFKSVGVGVQDVAIASLVLTKARKIGAGTRAPF
jgi:ornithine cyclodeaminase